DAGREAVAVLAAEIEQGDGHDRGQLELARNRVERAGDRRALAKERNPARGRDDRVGIAFLVRAFELGPEHTEVVADDPTEIPTVGMVDAGRILEAFDAESV